MTSAGLLLLGAGVGFAAGLLVWAVGIQRAIDGKDHR